MIKLAINQSQMTLGEYLRQLRIDKHEFIRQHSAHIGISMIAISEIEAGIRIPSSMEMNKIARYFDVPLESLMELAEKQGHLQQENI